MIDKSKIEKLGVWAWRMVPVVLVLGILCALLAPEGRPEVKKLGFVLIYWAGLPLLLGSFVLFSAKKGWLK